MSHQYFLEVPGGRLDALAVFLTSFPASNASENRPRDPGHSAPMGSSVLKPATSSGQITAALPFSG